MKLIKKTFIPFIAVILFSLLLSACARYVTEEGVYFSNRIVSFNGRYYLLYRVGETESLVTGASGKSVSLGKYGDANTESVDEFIAARATAYQNALESVGGIPTPKITKDAVIQYFVNDPEVVRIMTEDMKFEESAFHKNNCEAKEALFGDGSNVSVSEVAGTDGKMLFTPSATPTGVEFYIIAESVNNSFTEKPWVDFYNETIKKISG